MSKYQSPDALFILGDHSWLSWVPNFLRRNNGTYDYTVPSTYRELVEAHALIAPRAVVFLSHHDTLRRDLDWADKLRNEWTGAIVCQPAGLVEAAYDKRKMVRLLDGTDAILPIPEFSLSEAQHYLDASRGPIVMKRVCGTEGRALSIIHSHDELDHILGQHAAGISEWLFQPHINGLEVSVNACRFGDTLEVLEPVDKGYNSESGIHPSKRLRRCPSAMLSTLQKDNLRRVAENIVLAADTCGVIECEFLLQGDQIYLLEIYPRISATMRMNFLATDASLFSTLANAACGQASVAHLKTAVAHTCEFPLPANARALANKGLVRPGVWISSRVTLVESTEKELLRAMSAIENELQRVTDSDFGLLDEGLI